MSTPLTAEHALAWLAAGVIDPPASMAARQDTGEEARAFIARRFRACFGDYPDVLQIILEQSLFRPPVDHNLSGETYLRYAQNREGQNQLAAGILAYIDHAKSLEKKHHGRTRDPGPDAGADPEPGADPGADPFFAVR